MRGRVPGGGAPARGWCEGLTDATKSRRATAEYERYEVNATTRATMVTLIG